MEYSVLMTVYIGDNPEYFQLALDSMINQTKKPDEIVLVKDGPVTKELQKIIDSRKSKGNIVEVPLSKNLGLGLALNEGIKICKNELIARMDSDDISLPERCEFQIKAFQENPKLDIVGLQAKEFSGSIENIVGIRKVPLCNEDIYKFARKRDPFNHPTVMYKKSKIVGAGCYGNYRKNQDTALWIEMLKNKSVCLNLCEDLFRFRFDEDTYKKRKKWLNTKLLIEIRYKAFKDGFCSFFEFMEIFIAQMGVFIVPVKIQKKIYRKLLR